MKKFKFSTSFSSKVSVITPVEYCEQLSLASLNDLKRLFPVDIDVEKNPDLLLNAFNAAVANRINANDDGIGTEDALSLSPLFIHKFTDIEHDRDRVVGHIVSQAFSQFGSNEIMASESLASTDKPFNIALGAVVYKTVDEEFSDLLIESSDESSSRYNAVSASWELGFNKYNILIGHRDFSEGELITDERKVKELSKYLRVYGGSGKTRDNEQVYRVIVGGLPLGIGYTTSPAADVEGVIIQAEDDAQLAESDATREIIEITTTKEDPVRVSSELMQVVAETKQPLSEVIEATRRLAQDTKNRGLELSELFKRTKDALTLASTAGISSSDAVDGLTAAVNAFASQSLSSTEIINKFAFVDEKFATSALELAEATKRAGETAAQASVSFEDFIGFVTQAQEKTSRGGATIGNALKTLFTRIQRKEVLDQLSSFGIEISKDDKALAATVILENTAAKLVELSEEDNKKVTELLGGVFSTTILAAIFQNFEKVKNTFSQTTNTTVKDNVMVIKSLSDITDDALKNVSSASVVEFIKSELEKLGNDYKSQVKTKEDEVSSLAKQVEDFQKQLAEAQKAQKEADDKLAELQKQQAAAKADSDFNERMASLNESYTISDKDSPVIAKNIRGLDDAAYAEWFKDFEVLFEAKKKQQQSTASTTDVTTADQVLDKVTKTTQAAPANAAVTTEPTAFQKYQEAFTGDAITITAR